MTEKNVAQVALGHTAIDGLPAMGRLPNIHPGVVLLEEFLKPMAISQDALAKAIHVPEMHISDLCLGRCRLTADTAVRLAKFFGTSSGFWMGLQADYDIEEVLNQKKPEIDMIQTFDKRAMPA